MALDADSCVLETVIANWFTSKAAESVTGSRFSAVLKELSSTLTQVKVVLDEEKSIYSDDLKEWLDELTDTVFEADDLLDECSYEALRPRMESGSGTAPVHEVGNLLASWKTADSIEKITDSLEKIRVTLKGLIERNLREMESVAAGNQSLSNSTPTTSMLCDAPAAIYGRDDDKKTVWKLLLPSKDANDDEIGVIPIVGMGGIGKTTLAQCIYDDDNEVRKHFDNKAWVCVGGEFDIFKTIKNVIEHFSGELCGATELNMLEIRLREVVNGKRFLLVLDDVWNDTYEDWQILLRPLKFGVKGSKIIVTTRNGSVASILPASAVHHVRELKEDDCWNLFARHAIYDGNSRVHGKIEEIGRVIVRRCKGLPLTATVLARLLQTKTDAAEWKKILESNMRDLVGDSVLQILKLSFNNLPPELKQCFAFCAILPKGYEFQKEELISLWMAQCFLVQPQKNKEMKELGDEYFHLLLSMSFFQRSNVNRSYFVMHDIMNDLARFVAGDFYLGLEDGILYGSARRARHFLYGEAEGNDSAEFGRIYTAQSLRTFFSVHSSDRAPPKFINDKVMNHLLPYLRRLRVLYLSGYGNIVDLQDSTIRKLKHLRLLNISKTSITKLPDSLCRLYNLQTLVLYGCKDLTQLPDNLGKLINLCHLDIRGTNLQWMPPEIGKLAKLQKLTNFVVGKQHGSSIKELGMLQHLQGELSIQNLQNVLDARDVLEANLKGKKYLDKLLLIWDEVTPNSEFERVVLEQLEPHENVKDFSILGYGGRKFPDWVGASSFSNMVSMKLSGCTYCSSLPPIGQLSHLQELSITEFHGIEAVDDEFYGRPMAMKKPFESLRILRFERMEKWQKWTSDRDAFPLLQELYVHDCPKLMALPSGLPRLATLQIQRCQKLILKELPGAPNFRLQLQGISGLLELKKLHGEMCLLLDQFHEIDSMLKDRENPLFAEIEVIYISRCDSVECFPLELFPKLKRFDVSRCQKLKSLLRSKADGVSNFPLLQKLFIRECPTLTEAIPGDLCSLTTLEIEGCQQLLITSLPGSKDLHSMKLKADRCSVLLEKSKCNIRNWGLLKFFSLETFSELESLRIITCANLKSLCISEGNVECSKLKSLEIWGCPELVSFPEKGLVATNLQVLSIRGCSKLKSLPVDMWSGLSALVRLQINDCLELEQFPEGGLPKKLESLEIHSCDKLIAGCKQWGLDSLSSLSRFVFGKYKDAVSFPGDMALPASLKYLEIGHCKNLKSLGIQDLKSVRKLVIRNCPSLESIEGLPSSLSSLSICNCSKLEESCRENKEEIWSKIRCIKINYLTINGGGNDNVV